MKNIFILNAIILLIFYGCHSEKGIETNETEWQASEELVKQLSERQPAINYYESEVSEYTLPDPLIALNGEKIKTGKLWNESRREEVLELFRENVYGRVPESYYTKSFSLVNSNTNAMEGNATLKQVDIIIGTTEDKLIIHLSLFVPNEVKKPVPVFLLINNRDPVNIDPTRQKKSEFWPAEEVITRGYAIAAFYNADVDPDNFDNFQNGIHGILDQGERGGDSWGTLAAWAWGASRCVDYFETDKDIDNNKVAVVGHSRGGKTALWAGAEDKRFSIVISNESGCGGAALARRRYGETVERITSVFPHWFCSNYSKYADNEDNMPVDMHMLLALTAPRSLYIACAGDDLWGDPRGSYLALYNSMPVFKLLKTGSDIHHSMPPLDTQIISGGTGFHIREGRHNMLLKDWNWFVDFADIQWNNDN